MATNQIRKSGADPAAKADGKSGVTIDAGPYEATVVKHVEGTRSGQLLVYIPDWGGVKTDPNNQIMVSYASPFFGTTYNTDEQSSNPDGSNAQWTTGMSYGMWMVPPDLGNKVLVTFVAGDKQRGYWFACIYDTPSHHMVPAIGRNISSDSSKTLPPNPPDKLTDALGSDSVSPVVEAYSGQMSTFKPDGLTTNPRYVHEYQNLILVNQGLDRDKVRGAISSSSLREAPSNVYGISTPGRSVTQGGQIAASDTDYAPQAVISRKGGHSFVMDDGDKAGVDNLIRLRTAGGHQILMNDTENILYIASESGNHWLEFSKNGSINMFCKGNFNLRSQGVLNLHGDKGVNISTPKKVSINGDASVGVTSQGKVSVNAMIGITVAANGTLGLSAGGVATLAAGGKLTIGSGDAVNIDGSKIGLNNGSAPAPTPVIITTPSKDDVALVGPKWQKSGTIDTICTVLPAHEPWTRQ